MTKKILISLIGLIYDIIVFPVLIFAFILCLFVPKLKKYIGDRFLFNGKRLEGCDLIFFCSSIGEFDQIIPLVEKMKNNGYQPGILFHSTNGFNYANKLQYRHITLSPFDSFIFYVYLFNKIRPKITILNRNEAWPGFLTASAIFNKVYVTNFIDRKYKPIQHCIVLLFAYPVQKVFTCNPPDNFRCDKFVYTGDTKIDRVRQRLNNERNEIDELSDKYKIPPKKLLVLGNAYTNDCRILQRTLTGFPEIFRTWHFIIIPGRPVQMEELTTLFNLKDDTSPNLKIIPSFGNLLHYYAIADYVWIGGGFDTGIHNVIEASCAGKQMISGPNLHQLPLAFEVVKDGSLKLFSTETELYDLLTNFQPGNNKDYTDEINHTDKIFTNIVGYESHNPR